MKIRAVLDTNLWISYLISKKLSRMDSLFDNDQLVLLFSAELLEEFVEVANRPKFRSYFSFEDIEELLGLIDVYGEMVKVTSETNICRDPKDNFLLSLASDGQADYLVSGDKDLLDLKTFGSTKILRYSDFEELL